METSDPKMCHFRAAALNFVDRHVIGADVTPIDFKELDMEGVRSKARTPNGAMYAVNCTIYRHCTAKFVAELDDNTLTQTAWVGPCVGCLAVKQEEGSTNP